MVIPLIILHPHLVSNPSIVTSNSYHPHELFLHPPHLRLHLHLIYLLPHYHPPPYHLPSLLPPSHLHLLPRLIILVSYVDLVSLNRLIHHLIHPFDRPLSPLLHPLLSLLNPIRDPVPVPSLLLQP